MIYFSNKDIKLEMSSPKKAQDILTPHNHDFYEIIFMIDGDRRFFIHKDIYICQPGDIILIPPGCSHRAVTISETYERYLLYFNKNFVQESPLLSCFKTPHIQVSKRRFKEVADLLENIRSEIIKKDEYSDIMVKVYTQNLLMLLCRYSEKPSIREFDSCDKNIQQAAIYIRSHYRENLTLQQIADAVYLSPSYLSKRFKEVTGFGIVEYISGVRIREAELLLSGTNKSIVEIADRCGYNDSNYFGDVFKKIVGCSPTQYRKQNSYKRIQK